MVKSCLMCLNVQCIRLINLFTYVNCKLNSKKESKKSSFQPSSGVLCSHAHIPLNLTKYIKAYLIGSRGIKSMLVVLLRGILRCFGWKTFDANLSILTPYLIINGLAKSRFTISTVTPSWSWTVTPSNNCVFSRVVARRGKVSISQLAAFR